MYVVMTRYVMTVIIRIFVFEYDNVFTSFLQSDAS
jgi:hypothetical protein